MKTSLAKTGRKKRLPRWCAGYFWFLVAIFFFERLFAERWWLATLCDYAPQVITLLPTGLLAFIALCMRDGRALRWCVACGLVWMLLEGWRWNAPTQVAPDETEIKLLTYNILHGDAGVERIAEAIAGGGFDIVCLQEASGFLGHPDPLPILERKLPSHRWARFSDVAIGVRGRLVSYRGESFRFSGSGRGMLIARCEVKGRPITLIGTHLATAARSRNLFQETKNLPNYIAHTAEARKVQTLQLLAAARQERGPVVLCGDFNTPPRGTIYRWLTREYTDAFNARGRGFGWTYSHRKPLLRIDHAFLGQGVRALDAQVLPWSLSDHKALSVRLALRP